MSACFLTLTNDMLTALGWMTIGAFLCIFAACCLCIWGAKVFITGR